MKKIFAIIIVITGISFLIYGTYSKFLSNKKEEETPCQTDRTSNACVEYNKDLAINIVKKAYESIEDTRNYEYRAEISGNSEWTHVVYLSTDDFDAIYSVNISSNTPHLDNLKNK